RPNFVRWLRCSHLDEGGRGGLGVAEAVEGVGGGVVWGVSVFSF
ncbi:hypothetical protein A2U01_0068532, partial [Trifolium medium]|nr:hypothetical protein [Trifolium medium]